MTRKVTEQDIRLPEFFDAKVEDLEFRADGKIVRKDRWECSLRAIAGDLGFNIRAGFEVWDVVNVARELADEMAGVRAAAADQIWEGIKNGHIFS